MKRKTETSWDFRLINDNSASLSFNRDKRNNVTKEYRFIENDVE